MEFPKIRFAAGLLAATLAFACAQPGPTPPVAQKKAQTLEAHGDVRVDDYYWLRERTNPEVLAYLEAENAYTEAVLADTAVLRAELFEELKNRIEPDDSTVPVRYNDYYYLTRYEGELEYPIYCRRKGSLDAPDEVILDVNQVAEGHDILLGPQPGGEPGRDAVGVGGGHRRPAQVHDPRHRPGDRRAARRRSLRCHRQFRLGQRQSDALLHATGPRDACAPTRCGGTGSEPIRLKTSWSTKNSIPPSACTCGRPGLRSTSSSNPSKPWRPSAGFSMPTTQRQNHRSSRRRERDVEYSVDHVGDRFIIRTNLEAENFRLMEAPVARPGRADWKRDSSRPRGCVPPGSRGLSGLHGGDRTPRRSAPPPGHSVGRRRPG